MDLKIDQNSQIWTLGPPIEDFVAGPRLGVVAAAAGAARNLRRNRPQIRALLSAIAVTIAAAEAEFPHRLIHRARKRGTQVAGANRRFA